MFSYLFEQGESVEDYAILGSEYSNFYQNYIYTLVSAYQQSKEKEYLYKAYNQTNHYKNIGLLQALRQKTFIHYSRIPYDLSSHFFNLKKEVNNLEKAVLLEDIPTPENDSLVDLLLAKREKLTTAMSVIKQDFPLVNDLHTLPESIDVEVIKSEIPQKVALLDFVLTDSFLLAFVLQSSGLDVLQFPCRKSVFSEEVANWSSRLSAKKSLSSTPDFLVKFREDLLPFLNTEVEHLVVLPDAFLAYVPFELVFRKKDGYSLPFTISYANSLGILQSQWHWKPRKRNKDVVIFAPQYQNPGTSQARTGTLQPVSNLPFSREEAENIRQILGKNARVLTDNIRGHLEEEFSSAKILHFTMHAKLDDKRPMDSRFLFSGNSEEDLYLYDLYHMESSARLAVLSACETGLGKLNSGAGIRSLANGFQYAGVPSVVTTLWKVPDQSSSIIMSSFYKHLKDGQTLDHALVNAKKDYLDQTVSDSLKHPYYWAGFILIGKTDAVNDSAPAILYIGGIALLIFLMVFLFFRMVR